MKRILIISSVFIMMMLTMGFVSASDDIADELSQNNETTVSLDDSPDIRSSDVEGNRFEDIQKAVDNTASGGVIELSGNYTGYNQIIVSKSLTFQSTGKPSTLKGDGSRIFNIQKGDVTFKNIIFTNGDDVDGGAVYSSGNCNFVNCEFKNNKADKTGGAVYSNGNSKFTNCIFKGNSAKDVGAIYSEGSLTLTKSTFEANKASGYGGAVYCDYVIKKSASKSHYGNVVIDGCTFTQNTVERGGALIIYLDFYKNEKNYGNLKIKNSRFDKNSASEWGGAIYFGGDTNFKGKVTIDNTDFTQNTAEEGSAIFIFQADFTITNSNFKKNSGGGLISSSDNTGTIKKSNFIANSAEYRGGIIMDSGKLSIIDSTFKSNKAQILSCVALQNSKASIVDSTFKSNSLSAVAMDKDSQLKITKKKSTKTYKKAMAFSNSLKKYVGVTVKAKNMVGKYNTYKKFTIKLLNKKTKKPMANFAFKIILKKGKKTKTIMKGTNKKGKATFSLNYRIKAGKYKVSFVSNDFGLIDNTKKTLKVKKGPATVHAPQVTAKYKKSNNFKATFKNPSGDLYHSIKVKIKVFTGKNAKTYHLKANDDGEVKINTKTLSRGTHEVVITSDDENLKFSAKSKIIIE